MADTCGSCAARLAAGADWCARCHRSVRAAPVAVALAVPMRPGEALPFKRERARDLNRYAATEVTFGLRGRVVMSVLLTLPLVWFVWLAVNLIADAGIAGLALYGGFVYPKAMRHTWRRSDRL